MDRKKILEKIERAAAEGATSLDLSENQLTSLPQGIAKLTNLTRLDLRNNQLTSLPPEIAKLTKLTSLFLSVNQLTSLPQEIARLTKLTSLFLRENQLTSLPQEIIKLTNLEVLSLSGNQLTSLPQEITRLTNLRDLDLSGTQLTSLPQEITWLTNLTDLNLSGIQLKRLPPEIAKLTNLTRLDLLKNQLTSLPAEITKLTNLTSLDLIGNQLTSLPPEIAKLTNLTDLALSYNQLTSLPPEITNLTKLTSLNLSGNQLTSLPPEITNLTKLTSLDLRGNQLTIPPEVLANPRNVKEIFAALAGLWGGQRLNEAKMLVVGDGKVGKSSVVERLIKGTFDAKKETTLGVEINDEIEVSQWEVESEGDPIKLNIWDFGGQEIQHSTHQFFLTTRSLYLLVVDARKGDQISGIEYWLKLIGSFGGDSSIIVVINQIDQLKGQRPLNLDRKALQEKYNIKEFIETSCPDPPIGIEELRSAIAREVGQLKHARDLWPRAWLAIKQRLREMKEDYIPVEKYLEICREEKLDDTDLRESLLGLLHDLGAVIRFAGDTQVLNPKWVTKGVYGLLTSARLVKSQGQFDLKDVGEILEGIAETRGRYPSHTHRRLIDVMKHFELCFEFTDRQSHYLIPRHLQDNELDINWDDSDALQFQYHYETLPDAIISRFIVRMNQYIQKQFYWKNGVFLKDGDNRAKIKADLVDRKIFISIIGKEQTRRGFLAVIRSAFDEINSNFKIVIKRMIPLPDYPDVLVSYDDLVVYENNNKQTYFVATRGVEKDYNVRLLLDGVEDLRDRLVRRERDLEERRFSRRMPEELTPKPQQSTRAQKNNPWVSGSFYLFSYVVVIATIVIAIIVLNKYGVSWTTGAVLAVVLIGGLLGIGVIGANQLKNDELLSDKSYVKLMIESYKRLPLLRGKGESNNLLEGTVKKKQASRKKRQAS
ncbi:MAG TPA: COR domain-containing protein [Blastocatellia bacterium]|nr:COR domain-containing protein [Blastocatellia bacterium]